MKMRSVVAASNIGFMCLLMIGIAAEAAELKVLSATGMQTVMAVSYTHLTLPTILRV